MKLFLKKWIFEKVLKQTTSLLNSFSGDYLKAPTMTYGGDEEIVLKGGAKKKLRPEVK
jgi:hypothetical protein